MKDPTDEVHFEEDRAYFLRKKALDLAFGSILLLVMPPILSYMFLYLLRASELHPTESGLTMAFLFFSIILGAYLVGRGLITPRIRFLGENMTYPGLPWKKPIPYDDNTECLSFASKGDKLSDQLYYKTNRAYYAHT